MKNTALKGKSRSGGLRRRVRKSKKLILTKARALGSKEILQELNGAKNAAHTRRAFAIAKLFGSSVPAAYNRARKWGSVSKKVLLHPLPPRTSLAATAFVMVWALVGLGVSASSGFNSSTLSTPPAKNILAVSQQPEFNPVKDFKNSLASFKESINNQLALLVSQAQALAPLPPKTNLAFIYYHAPVNLPPSQTQALSGLTQQTAPTSNNFLPQGRVLGASTVKKVFSARVKTAPTSVSLKQQIETILNSYLAEGKFQGQKGEAGASSVVTQNSNGQTTDVIGGNPVITYVPAQPQNGFYGTTLSGFGNLSASDISAAAASVSGSFAVQGAANFTGTVNLANSPGNGSELLVDQPNSSTIINSKSGILLSNSGTTVGNYAIIGFADASNGLPSAKIGVQFTDRANHYGDFVIGTRNASGMNEVLRVTSAGNVGIGTTTPTQALTLSGNALFSGHMSLGNVGGVNNEIENYGDSLQQTNDNFPTDLNINDYRSGDISYNNANYQENFTVYPSFDNTSSSAGSIYSVDVEPEITASSTGPFTTLDGGYYSTTNDGVGIVINQTSVTGKAFNYASGTVTNLTGLYGYAENNSTGNVTNSYGVYADPAFNEGSGIINNAYGVYVAQPANVGTVGNNYGLYVDDQSVITATGSNFNIYSAGKGKNYFGGNVGIGTTTLAATLALQGSGTTTPFTISSSSGATLMTVAPSGNVTITGSATTCTLGNGTSGTNCSSDERLKTNIIPISDALDKLALINGVTFNWADPSKDQSQFLGVIAQNVLTAFPQAVSTSTVVFDGAPGNYYSVDYGALVGPLISGVNELNARTDFATTATTSALELTTAASNVSGTTPWVADFVSASAGLQAAIQSIGSQIVHVFGQAIYATSGIFDKVFAKEVHTDELCVGSTCVTQAQFLQMVQQAGVNQNANAYVAQPTAQNPVPDSSAGNSTSTDGSSVQATSATSTPDQTLPDSPAAGQSATSTP